MSEIAKCPFCGEEPEQVDHGWNSTCDFYECCGVLAEEEKWNKIAAAMELAKTIVESENCKAEDEYKYQEFVEWARQYVLEVFK
jgi:hypothetical protein